MFKISPISTNVRDWSSFSMPALTPSAFSDSGCDLQVLNQCYFCYCCFSCLCLWWALNMYRAWTMLCHVPHLMASVALFSIPPICVVIHLLIICIAAPTQNTTVRHCSWLPRLRSTLLWITLPLQHSDHGGNIQIIFAVWSRLVGFHLFNRLLQFVSQGVNLVCIRWVKKLHSALLGIPCTM